MEALPNEIVENIVVFLGLNDIRNLRRTSQTLALKTTQDHFKSFYRTKHVELTSRALRALVDATRPGQLGSLVEELVLSGILIDNTPVADSPLQVFEGAAQDASSNESPVQSKGAAFPDPQAVVRAAEDDPTHLKGGLSESQPAGWELEHLGEALDDIERRGEAFDNIELLLGEAFGNIKANGRSGKLYKLSLQVNAYHHDGALQSLPIAEVEAWELVWKCAANTVNNTFKSLSFSSLPIDQLNLFNQEHLNRCSIACNELSQSLSNHDMTTSLRSLKSISVSLSDRDIGWQGQMDHNHYRMTYQQPKSRREISHSQTLAEEELNFDGLAKLLRLTDALEDLDIHYFNLRRPDPTSIRYARENLFHRMATIPTLPKLNRCRLRGLHVTEPDLLDFVKTTAPRNLTITNTTMSSGKFLSLFEHCSGKDNDIENLFFDELRDSTCSITMRPLHFQLTNNPEQMACTFSRGDWTLKRVGLENKDPIQAYVPQNASSSIDYEQRQEWLRQKRLIYGPP